ncbi:MAG: EamA family transporter [Tessaracoccus sp.]
MSKARLAGIGAITITSILWGTTGTAATFAPSVGPLATGAAALGLGGLLQAAIAVGALRAARPHLSAHRGLVALGAFAVAIYPLAFYSSMHLAGVAVGSVVSLASAPLASGLLERLVERRRPADGGCWRRHRRGRQRTVVSSKLGDSSGSVTATVAGMLLAGGGRPLRPIPGWPLA